MSASNRFLCWRFSVMILFILPSCILCQQTTTASITTTAAGQTSSQLSTGAVQANTTKSPTTPSATNTTKPPLTGNGTTTAVPTTQLGNTTAAANGTMTTPDTNTTESTTMVATNQTDEVPTEGVATDESTATMSTDTETTTMVVTPTGSEPEYFELCPSGLACEDLIAPCLNCSLDDTCVYGREYNATCVPNEGLDCVGSLPIQKTYQCRYCYQTDPWQQQCTPASNCQVHACPKQYIKVNCTVDDEMLCLGSRNFHRRKPCNWTSGYKWTTALILSVTLGGFGADRFYLGYWQSGLGKLFSFGGAGVWTLIDVLLIAVGYITPSDGSHYIY